MRTKKPYNCGLGPALEIVGGKWKAMILWELHDGPKRFGELRRAVVGISEKMLIQELRDLENDELVTRKVYKQVPPKVEYTLTAFGISLNEALAPLTKWGEEHEERILGRLNNAAGA